jgi:hypothetical protein
MMDKRKNGIGARGRGRHIGAVVEAVYTVMRLYRCLDERDYKGVAALMAPDGVWHRQGEQLVGEAEILKALSKRSPTLVIHHLLSNMFADVADDDAVQVTGYLQVVRYDDGAPVSGPAPFLGVENIRTIRANLAPTAHGWRIQCMSTDPIRFAAPSSAKASSNKTA